MGWAPVEELEEGQLEVGESGLSVEVVVSASDDSLPLEFELPLLLSSLLPPLVAPIRLLEASISPPRPHLPWSAEHGSRALAHCHEAVLHMPEPHYGIPPCLGSPRRRVFRSWEAPSCCCGCCHRWGRMKSVVMKLPYLRWHIGRNRLWDRTRPAESRLCYYCR